MLRALVVTRPLVAFVALHISTPCSALTPIGKLNRVAGTYTSPNSTHIHNHDRGSHGLRGSQRHRTYKHRRARNNDDNGVFIMHSALVVRQHGNATEFAPDHIDRLDAASKKHPDHHNRVRYLVGIPILIIGLVFWLGVVPYYFYQYWDIYETHHNPATQSVVVSARGHVRSQGKTFDEYITYNFNHWLTTHGILATMTMLFILCASSIVLGSVLYLLFRGHNILEGLWLSFLWVSASSVDPTISVPARVVGCIMTVAGIVLLALMVTAFTDWFQGKMAAIAEGRDAVVEKGHYLIIGYYETTKYIVQELARSLEDLDHGDHVTVVILGQDLPKQEIENALKREIDESLLDKLRIVVRTGKHNSWPDLRHVAADTAKSIIIPQDPNLSREEADAKTFGALLTLRSHKCPNEGFLVAECCSTKNHHLMHSLQKDHAYVFDSERFGRIFVQGAQDPGTCQVWDSLIGFIGDEFYTITARDLGTIGLCFWEMAFLFKGAIPLGIVTGSGEFLVNPKRYRETREDDTVVLLASDHTGTKRSATPYFNITKWKPLHQKNATFKDRCQNDFLKVKCLVANFSDRGVGCAILYALEDMLATDSQVDIYTGDSETETRDALDLAQKRMGSFVNIRLNIITARRNTMCARFQLNDLPLEEYSYIFVLADLCEETPALADQKTVGMVLQMKDLLHYRAPNVHFDPVVEVLGTNTRRQLECAGFGSIVNTPNITSRALAMIACHPTNYGVLHDLLSSHGNNIDIQELESYLAEGEELPAQLDFATATAYVTRSAQQVLLGWSEAAHHGKTPWVLNPKDKRKLRPWSPKDRLIVVKELPENPSPRSHAHPRTEQGALEQRSSIPPSRRVSLFNEDDAAANEDLVVESSSESASDSGQAFRRSPSYF